MVIVIKEITHNNERRESNGEKLIGLIEALGKQTWHFQMESIGIVSRMYVKKREENWEMGQDIIDDAKEEGRQDMREPMVAMLKGMLSRFGTLPDEVVRRIDQETDMDKITVWAQLVVKAKSLEDFVDQM